MSSIQETITDRLIEPAAAANADQLDAQRANAPANLTATATGWDAYEVWRRFIKEARERRENPSDR
ncbi:MAG TPA: hypothetical protein VFR96_10905 [Povalibacter sp.]|nr:hypothetical protein [Povalibacter sp.]